MHDGTVEYDTLSCSLDVYMESNTALCCGMWRYFQSIATYSTTWTLKDYIAEITRSHLKVYSYVPIVVTAVDPAELKMHVHPTELELYE
jgi:hypothetical protein